MKRLALLIALSGLCLWGPCPAPARAGTPPAAYTPTATTVALLPVISKEDSKVGYLYTSHTRLNAFLFAAS